LHKETAFHIRRRLFDTGLNAQSAKRKAQGTRDILISQAKRLSHKHKESAYRIRGRVFHGTAFYAADRFFTHNTGYNKEIGALTRQTGFVCGEYNKACGSGARRPKHAQPQCR